jgi:hypothetical protein
VAELWQTPEGYHLVIATEDIQNRVRKLEKAAAADLALVPSITCCVSSVPPSGRPGILAGDSIECRPDAASTTALIVSRVSKQVEESM